MNKRLLINTLSSTILYLITVIVTFIICPLLIKSLGNRDYGLWELVMSVIGYMGLLDLGIGGALVRFVSVADGRQDRDDLQQTISTAFAFFAVVGFISVTLFISLGYSPGLIAGSETRDIANLGTVFILLGVNAGMLFPQQVFIATLMGVQRHYFINGTRALLLIVKAGLTYYLLLRYLGHGLIILALLEPVFTAIQLVLFAGAVYLDKNIPNMSLAAIKLGKAKEMISFGAKSASMLVASRLQNQSVPLIIGNILGLGQIVYFVMPNRLVDYAKGMSQAIGFPLTPYFGAAIGRGDHDELIKSWLNSTLALQTVALAMPIAIFFFGETFLGLWIGQEYAIAGRVILYILLAGLVADSLATNAFRMLTAQGKHGISALVWLVFSALSIPLGIWGAQQWGVAGIAAGSNAVTIVANIITVFMACSVMKVSLKTYFSETLFRVALPLLTMAVVMWTLTCNFPVTSYASLIVQLLIAGVVYVGAVWRFTLDKEVQERLSNRMRVLIANH